jgi:hypothetical protein
MERDGSGVSALVGLDGFVVNAQLLDDDSGEWWLAVETLEDRAWCETCAVRAVGHGRRRVVVRDLPMADRPVVLVWAKRQWRCPEPACAVRTWCEESDEIAPRAVLTERARAEICRRVGPAQHSIAQAWLGSKPAPWLAGVRHVVIDPYQPYATAVAAGLADARLVVDHFHVVRLANSARTAAIAACHDTPKSRAVGLDETSFLAATAEHPTLLVTGIIDLDTGRLVDVVPARSAVAVTDCSMRFAVAASTPPPDTGAASTTRSTGSADDCWLATNGSAQPASPESSPTSTQGTPTARSAPPTSPRSCYARASTHLTCSRPADASSRSTTTAPPATYPSSSDWPARSPAGKSRSCAGTAPA